MRQEIPVSSVSDPYTFFTDPDPEYFSIRIRIQVKNTFFHRQLQNFCGKFVSRPEKYLGILVKKECFYGRIFKNKMNIMKKKKVDYL